MKSYLNTARRLDAPVLSVTAVTQAPKHRSATKSATNLKFRSGKTAAWPAAARPVTIGQVVATSAWSGGSDDQQIYSANRLAKMVASFSGLGFSSSMPSVLVSPSSVTQISVPTLSGAFASSQATASPLPDVWTQAPTKPATPTVSPRSGTEPTSEINVLPVPAAGQGESSVSSINGSNATADWRASWASAAAATPCGSCTGRACTMCSVRTGGPTMANGQPTGYAQRTLLLYQPEETLAPAGKLSVAPQSFAVQSEFATVQSLTVTNAIVLENLKQGTPESEWMIGLSDPTIEGFAAQFTINHGNTVDFKINTDSLNYRIDIYRLGYYGGDGARKVATINKNLTTAQTQPTPLFDQVRKLVDAGNWSVTASWAIPQDAVSGVYFARLTRFDGSGGASVIPFIVRDDEAPSDITFQTSDTTWQAYNWWGGYNLYGGVDVGGHAGRASAVSYNRPITTRDGGFSAGPQDFVFGVEYPAIRFLEQNGYDVNYISGIDTASNAAQLLNSKIFLSVGHDEYWSAEQRDNVEAARDAGVNLSFWSGNEIYWQTRWETSIDGSGTPYKTLVSYKERWDNANSDTQGTTSTWRDPVFGSGEPENALTGTMFTVDSYRLDAINVPYDMSNLRFWTNTAVADLEPGQVYTLTKNLLGYEWDSDVDNGFRPAGLVPLSSTTVDVNTKLLDYGNAVGPGTASHSLTLYRAPSGALVFGAGTVYWAWGLDSHHDNEATPIDRNVQQSMINLFAEMGVQPATLMQSLAVATQSTDHTAPTTTITSPTATGSLSAAHTYTITGTAVDAGGGRIAVVEVSVDGGTSWRRATGYDNWTYSWTPLVGGTYTILSRAVDDSVNLETPSAGVTVNVSQGGAGTLFAQTDTPSVPFSSDSNPVTLGVTFTSTQSGSIVGLRYYKGVGNAGDHVGSLWTSTGTLLASATFKNESVSGWQTVLFDNPISITAGTTYVASYFGTLGYAVTTNYFATPHTRGALTATNGSFTYGNQNLFPSTQSNGSNYWVDVVFSGAETPNSPPVGANDNNFLVARNTPVTFTFAQLLANDTDPNNDVLSIIGAGAASGGTVVMNAQQQTLTFTPNAGYLGPATFGYSISDGRGGTGSAFVNMEVVTSVTTNSLFNTSDTPSNLASSDASRVNLGVQFVASASGTITGMRYYKSASDTGTHVGSLWNSTGTLLASATFANETASGWQTVSFNTPVQITAGTTYVASYLSNGRYASTPNYFVTDKVSGLLRAPAAGNGVFSYGNVSAMPTSSFNNTNYWVDVVMTSASTTNRSPVAANDTGYTTQQNVALQIAASALLLNDSDPDGDPLSITGVSGALNGTVAFNAQTNVVTFTPNTGYSGAASFSYAISDGRGGTASATASLTVTPASSGTTLFAANATPATVSVSDANSVELGMKFTVASNGTITGMRFYKSAQNTGTHTGTLWTSTGTQLGTVTFTNESASGWQSATFANPIAVTSGTTYVVSYHAPNGYYSASGGYFAAGATTNGALTAPQSVNGNGNGVFAYGTSTLFPTGTYNATNYWVDVYYQSAANVAPVANADSGFSVQRDTPLTIAASALLANDTDANGDALSITGVSGASNGAVAYDAVAKTVTFTPNAGYTGAASFNYAISDGRGGAASASVALTVKAPVTNTSLFASTATPTTTTVNDPNSVELGMRFTTSQNGTITGIRFYKGPQNTGTHTGTLWSSTGAQLGTVTFQNETASGWQTATFATPISVTAGTNYVVSYHSNGYYSATANGFASPVTSGPLTAPSSGSSGGNGLYAYGGASAFPTNSYNATNYYVDVIFNASLAS